MCRKRHTQSDGGNPSMGNAVEQQTDIYHAKNTGSNLETSGFYDGAARLPCLARSPSAPSGDSTANVWATHLDDVLSLEFDVAIMSVLPVASGRQTLKCSTDLLTRTKSVDVRDVGQPSLR